MDVIQSPAGHTHARPSQEVLVFLWLPSLIPLGRVAITLSVLGVSFYSNYYTVGGCLFMCLPTILWPPFEQGLVLLGVCSFCHLVAALYCQWNGTALNFSSQIEASWEWQETPMQKERERKERTGGESREFIFLQVLCPVDGSVAETRGSSFQPSCWCQRLKARQQPEKATESCKLKWFPALRMYAHIPSLNLLLQVPERVVQTLL